MGLYSPFISIKIMHMLCIYLDRHKKLYALQINGCFYISIYFIHFPPFISNGVFFLNKMIVLYFVSIIFII